MNKRFFVALNLPIVSLPSLLNMKKVTDQSGVSHLIEG